jgi:hypothetical protein
MNRKVSLIISAIVSLALHGWLISAAPRITLLYAASTPPEVLQRFQVDLAPYIEAPSLAPADAQVAADALGAPAVMSDPSFDMPNSLTEAAALPDLADRLEADAIARDHALVPDELVLAKMDAKIIEISQTTARDDINITRRLVRPSPSRVVGEGEFPALRGAADLSSEEVILITPRKPDSSGETPTDDAEAPLSLVDAIDDPVDMPIIPEAGLPELPVEEVMARAPLIQSIKRETTAEALDDLLAFELSTYVPPGGPEGFFRLRAMPRDGGAIPSLRKDLTFVIDSSGSILQRKLDLTSRGLKDALNALHPEDRFNVVLFRESPSSFRSEPVFATAENKAACENFLERMESRGETDVYNAMLPVVHRLPRTGSPGIVLVITDGRPTKGLQDGQAIINSVTDENAFRNSIFAFSAGRTVNRYMLDLLAYRNKGESFFAGDIENIDEALPQFVSQLRDPLLVDVQADFGRMSEDEIYPKNIPDFYRSRAVTIYGRYDPVKDADFVVRLRGAAEAEAKEVIYKADLAGAARGEAEIARGWAFRKVYHLIGEICRVGEQPQLLSELRELSSAYNIKTVYDR